MSFDGPTVIIGRGIEGRITFSAPIVATDDQGYIRLPMLVEEQGLSIASTVELQGWGGGAPGLAPEPETLVAMPREPV